MNTKTSYKFPHNFYDGSNHAQGREGGPGALLDMLAEVASRTLRSESVRAADPSTKRTKQKVNGAREIRANLPRLLSMPRTQLVKNFAVPTSDELKRRYTYECALVPGCQQRYTSFASETRARISITAHLVEHLERLRNNDDDDDYSRQGDTSEAGDALKKHRVQQRGKKNQEIPNKENELAKSEKSTSYLRKILSDGMNFNEFEWKNEIPDEQPPTDTMEREIPFDHSYYERVKEESEATINGESDNIMLMVVESDRVSIKELTSHGGILDREDATIDSLDYADTAAAAAAAAAAAKPKGKAKFIGTSKEEREMALVLMERIKKKGNPSGNNLQCRICDPPRSFTAPTTLVSHYRSHAGIKPYECRICRSVFTRRHSLKYHMLIHQNQTRFTCADCGKKFRHPSHFREHRRRHTGESPFGCEDCGQRFKTRNTYKRHLKTRHGKVLTTSGELLRLTEEEFQKVQTNRKRKSISSDSTSTGSTVRTVFDDDNATKIDACFEDNEESSDRILYDGIVPTGEKMEEEEQLEEEFVDSSMLENLSNCINGDEYENVEYVDQNSKVIVVDENNEFIVPYDHRVGEYYESGSIVDEEMVEFSEHRLEVGNSGEQQRCSTSPSRAYAEIPLNLDNSRDEKLVENIRYPSYIDKTCHDSINNNNNNNNNNDNINNNNESENNSILDDETVEITQLEAASIHVDEMQRAIVDAPSFVESTTFIVPRNSDNGADYLRIDTDDIVVSQQLNDIA